MRAIRLSSVLLPLATALSLGTAAPAGAYCLVDPAHVTGRLGLELERRPQVMVGVVRRALAAHPPADRVGWLWATMAVGHLLLDRADLAAADADRGLSVMATRAADPARLQLLVLQAGASEDESAALAGIARLEQARRTLVAGSPAEICTAAAIGQLYHVIDRPQDATRVVTAAYRASLRPGLASERAWLSMLMGAVMLRANDTAAALSLTADGLALARANGLPITQANLLYQRGLIFIDRRHYRAALASLSESTEIARRLQGPESAAYAAMGGCEASLELRRIATARRLCEQAAGPLAKTSSTKKVSLLLARIALAERRPLVALAATNRVLDGKTETATSTIANEALEVRARARAALGDLRGAYADLSEHLRRTKIAYRAVLESQTAQLRTHMKVDRRDAQNAVLRTELRRATEKSRSRNRRVLIFALAGLAVIGLLAQALLLARGHRRRLVTLAETDALTGLRNRRALYRLVQNDDRIGLTIAMIDLDGFKGLNDRHGHAAGDRALIAFAAAARSILRPGDIVGRWGGEEFLVLLQDSDAEKAVAIVDRIRRAAAAVDLGLGPDGRLAFSAGVATRPGPGLPFDLLIAAADAALYRAKAAGRGRTLVAGPDDLQPRARNPVSAVVR